MSHRKFAIVLSALVAATAVFVLMFASSASAAPVCHDDEPCWHWSTMGNLDRGVVLKRGSSHADCTRTFRRGAIRACVVDACGFAALDFRARIDWKRTPRLRGDWFARQHGCNPALYAPDAG